MKRPSFRTGQPVLILAHPETHDFGTRAGFVVHDGWPVSEGYVAVRESNDSVTYCAPRLALRSEEQLGLPASPQAIEQIGRAAAGIATLAFVFGALFWLTSVAPAKAQDASVSTLSFYAQEREPAAAHRRGLTKPGPGDVVETGRWVNIPLPPPPPYVRGRLTCAVNVNRYLARMGKPTTGSALAHSFLRWGRPSGPRPGAVQVERRRGGGHVKIVSHHDGARWMCLNPSVSRQAWHLTPCGGRAMAWRAA